MDEYISREEAIKELREVYENEYPTASGDFDEYASHDMPNVLRNIPAADVQPVKHGEWRKKFLSDTICCSECKVTWSSSFKDMLNGFNYCPNCGARMDLGDEKT